MKYIIQDWACNVLQESGDFNFGNYGKDKGFPMKFDSFEDAWDWIYTNIEPENDNEDKYEDLCVEKLS